MQIKSRRKGDADLYEYIGTNMFYDLVKVYGAYIEFYFKMANKQFEKKKIFEKGMRDAYVEFIDIVGLSTFKNLFVPYLIDIKRPRRNILSGAFYYVYLKHDKSHIKNSSFFTTTSHLELL